MTDPPFDLGRLMQTARDLQGKLAAANEAAEKIEVEGNAGGGMVVAKANGHGQLVRLTIEPSILEDREMVEDLVVAAVNQALTRAAEARQQQLSSATGGLPLGDLSKLF